MLLAKFGKVGMTIIANREELLNKQKTVLKCPILAVSFQSLVKRYQPKQRPLIHRLI